MKAGVKSQSEDPFGPLFECSWFYRMWTIQEISIAFVDRTFVRCGALEVPWAVLMIAQDGMKTSKYKWGRWAEATSLQKQFMTYLIVQRMPEARAMLDDGKGTYHNDPTVFDILTNTRKKQAGEPKDKVFALYGLMKELEVPFPKPDYSLSVEDAYREATVASIKYDKNLYILYHVPSDQRRPDLASWVPDFSEPGFDPDDPRYGVLRDRFAASGPGAPLYKFSEDHRTLTLRGKVIDTIIYTADAMPGTSEFVSSIGDGSVITERPDEYMKFIHETSAIFRAWVDISKWGDYPTGEQSKDALQRTLVADWPENNVTATTDNSFKEWYDSMNMDELDLLASGLERMGLAEQLPRVTAWGGASKRYELLRRMKEQISDETSSFMAFGSNAFASVALVWSAMRCFFYTENTYFGTAPDPLPDSIQTGDKIVLISGLEMPLVMRSVEGGFRLITHVYVHGIMYGEMWPEDGRELQDIVLV